jgi:hypothetical protein
MWNNIRRFAFYLLIGLFAFLAGVLSVQFLLDRKPKPDTIQVELKVDELYRRVNDIDSKAATQKPQNSPKETNAKFTCNDKIILAVLSDIKRNNELQDRFQLSVENNPIADCKDMFRVEDKDLNRDGIDEFFVATTGGYLCSARSDCPTWVVSQKAGKFRVILYAGLVEDLGDSKTYFGGYKMLESTRTSGGCCHMYGEYRFEKDRYKVFKCIEGIWDADFHETLKSRKPSECRAE